MFGKALVNDMIDRSAENGTDRRNFMRSAGLAGLGVIGAGAVGAATAGAASATSGTSGSSAGAGAISDAAILNFALNLEYLEAEFYSFAAFGRGLADADTGGNYHARGPVTGGRKVTFATPAISQYAVEIANDEINHVKFLRAAIGDTAVARPAIDIQASFTAAARAAKLVGPTETFDPYANEDNFLLGAFLFEDVGVTAYKGAAPLISNKTYLEAAAGILAVEAYHAAIIRTVLYGRDFGPATEAIAGAINTLEPTVKAAQGILGTDGASNLVPADSNSIAFSRTPGQVLNIVYLNPGAVTSGGFFPAGVNGDLRVSG